MLPVLSGTFAIGGVKTAAEIRRANLELLVKEFETLDALAAAAGTTSVYLSQIRKQAKDRKTDRPREMGGAMARRLEQACRPPKPRGWMDLDHSAAGPSMGHTAEPHAPYRPTLAEMLQDEQIRQLLIDLGDIPPASRSKLIDAIHQQAEAAREAHEHLRLKERGKVATARRSGGRARRTITIRRGDGNPDQGALDLRMVDDPFQAEPSASEQAFYDRIAQTPKQER